LTSEDDFVASLRDIGHPEYPVLDKNYSPNSRIPCTDLIPFLVKCIDSNDAAAIKKIMSLVIEANPGVGIGPSWIAKSVDEILSIPFQRYIEFKTGEGLNELRAYFIVASKAGGGRQFLIANDNPKLFTQALVCHSPQWRPEMEELVAKANAWIETMAADIPFWETYQRFDSAFMKCREIGEGIATILRDLTPAARLQLFFAVGVNGGSLPNLTNYSIRNMGINVADTSRELTTHNLLMPTESIESIISAHSRNSLVELCQNYAVEFKNSWSKPKLAEAIASSDGGLLKRIANERMLVVPNFSEYEDLNDIDSVAKCHEAGFSLLCFA